MMPTPDAVVVGAGPNGLCAAIELARHGLQVHVVEAADGPGGGVRSAELTLPGFVHDVCSAIHPLAVASPFLRALELDREGLTWIHPPAAVAHALDDAPPVLLFPSVAETAAGLDPVDRAAWTGWVEGLIAVWDEVLDEILRPIRLPRHPGAALRFARSALRSGRGLARGRFDGVRAQALLAGISAHSVRPLTAPGSAAVGVVLGVTGHVAGWPLPRGGAGQIASALVRVLTRLGGTVDLGHRVGSLNELPPSRARLLDLTPRQILALAASTLPPGYARALARYRYGPGVFKLDWALSEPIPWRHRATRQAGTVHLGGTLDQLTEAMAAPERGKVADEPFLILAQPSLFDETRAPGSAHTAWAYCHVPNGWQGDLTELVEGRVERYAPGFRDTVLARAGAGPRELERRNANLVGGDIGGGAATLWQTIFRPVPRWDPYATPVPGLYLCSSSTPPGGGVHGMCGARAAARALKQVFGIQPKGWPA